MSRFVSPRLLCALAALFVLTMGARAETLEDALVESYNTNPQILSERAHLRAVDEGVPQALANWRPTITLSGSAGATRSTNSPYAPVLPVLVPFPTGACAVPPCVFNIPSSLPAYNNETPQTLDVNISQPIYRGGRTVAATAQAEKNVEAERARLLATEETVFFAVAQAYLDVVRGQATLELSIANEQLLRKQLESVQAQFKVGVVTRTDVAQAEAQLAGAVADRHQAEGNLQVSRANYERAVGHLPAKLAAPKLRPVLPGSREEALTLAANKNPNVIAALLTEDAAREAVKVVRGQLLPTLSIVGDYQRLNDVAFPHSDTTSASILARMTMPLYEGGAVYSATRQAEQTVGQLKGQTDDTRRASVQTATSAWETVASTRARRQALLETVKAAEIAFQGIQQEQKVGTRTVLDVLITEQTLFSDRVSLVATEHDLALAEFNLAAQTGRLTAVDLRLNVKPYDVNAHYRAVRDKWIGFGSGE